MSFLLAPVVQRTSPARSMKPILWRLFQKLPQWRNVASFAQMKKTVLTSLISDQLAFPLLTSVFCYLAVKIFTNARTVLLRRNGALKPVETMLKVFSQKTSSKFLLMSRKSLSAKEAATTKQIASSQRVRPKLPRVVLPPHSRGGAPEDLQSLQYRKCELCSGHRLWIQEWYNG